jgi:hypothetical protein
MVTTSAPPPKPLMYVSRDLDHKWIGNFMKKKHLALSHHIGKQETNSLYFSTADFVDLIQRIASVKGVGGLKLYFASYCATGAADVDAIAHAGWLGQLTLLFAATDNMRTDLGQYFMIRPLGGVLSLSKETASALVQCYQTEKVPLLTTLIKDAGVTNFRETRSLWYPLADFIGPYSLVREIELDGATGITAFIGSYGKGEKTPDGKDVSWQLNVVFELVKTVQHQKSTYIYHFDLEDTKGWDERPDPVQTEGSDTGNPCPPADCSSGLP